MSDMERGSFVACAHFLLIFLPNKAPPESKIVARIGLVERFVAEWKVRHNIFE